MSEIYFTRGMFFLFVAGVQASKLPSPQFSVLVVIGIALSTSYFVESFSEYRRYKKERTYDDE